MNYIILDMEWNQPFGGVKLVQKPVVLHGEIIQIGAIKADENFNYVDKIKIAVRPKFYKKMNPHVEKITGITSLQLTGGMAFPQAFSRFSAWCGEEFRFITWGFDDLGVLADNLVLHSLDPAFGKDYINLQVIYNKQVKSEHLQCGLSTAAESLGIPIDVQVHDALNDAYLTFEICKKLDMGLGIAEYANYTAVPAPPLFKDSIARIDMKHVLENQQAMNLNCPVCKKEKDIESKLKFREWLFGSGKACRTIGKCGGCGEEFSVKFKATKISEGNYTVVRSIFAASEEDISAFEEKLKKQRERKKKIAEKKAEAAKKAEGEDNA